MSGISVIIPARNAARTISGTLESLVPDAGLIGEVILVDDSSTDGTAECATDRARALGLPLSVHSVSAGSAGAARNKGLEHASCPFVFFLDADDRVLPGGLDMLSQALNSHPDAGLATGASVRKTPGSANLVRTPHGFGDDPVANADHYIRNGTQPISMGSGLVRMSALGDIRFPEAIRIDEDTWFWTALLAVAPVVSLSVPVMQYHLDSGRTARRYLADPFATWLAIGREFRRLEAFGVSSKALRWRRAWLAQRFARYLIKQGRHGEARKMLRAVMAQPELAREWRTTRYRFLAGAGQHLRRNHFAPAPHSPGTEHRTMFVCNDPPWPPVSGADLRNSRNATAAAGLGPVSIVSLRPAEQEQSAPEGLEVVALMKPGERRGRSMNWPRSAVESRVPRKVLDRLRGEIERFRPDTVVIEGINLQALIGPVRAAAPRLVLDMHNVESDLARRLASPGNLKQRFRIGLLERQEERALNNVDRVWTCTEADRDRLIAAYGHRTPVHVVPNAVPRLEDIPAALPTRSPAPGAPVLLFIGHLGYPPNVDAAVRLARFILPAVRTDLPGATLLLAGRYPKPAVRALADLPGVELHENPADLAPLLGRADVSVMPLADGGGSRIKILEAAAYGVPVVATPIAAEGLNLENGKAILIGETDAELARLTVKLASDAGGWNMIRSNAREVVLRAYGAEAIGHAVRIGLGLQPESDDAADPE